MIRQANVDFYSVFGRNSSILSAMAIANNSEENAENIDTGRKRGGFIPAAS